MLFNGVRVGDVSKIDLMPDDPSKVFAIIRVDGRVPVRTDTKVKLEFTGLTGSASVALNGASSAAPILKTSDGDPAVLFADRSDFQDLLQTAQKIAARASDILDRGDKILKDNEPAIRASVGNVQKFSDALAANSAGVKDFMSAMADVGRTIKPLTVKLEALTTDTDNVVKSVDPAQVHQMVADFTGTAAKLNTAAGKVDSTLTNLNGFLSTTDSKGVFQEVSDAAKSFKRPLRQHGRAHARAVRQPHPLLTRRPEGIHRPRLGRPHRGRRDDEADPLRRGQPAAIPVRAEVAGYFTWVWKPLPGHCGSKPTAVSPSMQSQSGSSISISLSSIEIARMTSIASRVPQRCPILFGTVAAKATNALRRLVPRGGLEGSRDKHSNYKGL